MPGGEKDFELTNWRRQSYQEVKNVVIAYLLQEYLGRVQRVEWFDYLPAARTRLAKGGGEWLKMSLRIGDVASPSHTNRLKNFCCFCCLHAAEILLAIMFVESSGTISLDNLAFSSRAMQRNIWLHQLVLPSYNKYQGCVVAYLLQELKWCIGSSWLGELARVGVKYFLQYLSQVQVLFKFASTSTSTSTQSTW